MKPHPSTRRSARNIRKASITLLALFAALSAGAATYTWDTVSGDGATITAGNGTWDLTGSNLVWNNSGANPNVAWAQTNTTTPLHTAIFAGTDTGSKSILIGTDIAANSLTFNNSGYTLSAAAAQTVRLNGDLTVAAGKSTSIGANTTVTRTTTAAFSILGGGTLNIQGAGARVIGNSNNISIGGGTTINVQTGGNFSGPSQMVVGSTAAGGNLLVNGGTVSAGATGTTASSAQNIVLHNLTTAGSSDLTINSGSVINLGTGRASSGESGLRFGSASSTTAAVFATVNLNGGTLTVARVYEGNAGSGLDSTFNFNGGTLKVTTGAGNAANYLDGLNNAFVKEGGAILDTNGVATTVAQVLQHGGAAPTDGGLTKRGTGTLTLIGNNTFTGTTTVDAGTLSLGRSGGTLLDTAAINVNGGTLDVAQADTVGAVTLTSGTISGAGALTGTSYSLKSGNVSSALAGSGIALTKDTGGTVILGGTQSYTGATNVNAGTLQVTGSLTSAISVGSSGTLSGEGSTTGNLTFASGSSFTFDPTTTGPGQHFISGGTINTTAGSGTKINIGLTSAVTSGTGLVVFEGASINTNGTSDFNLTSRGTLSLTATQLLFDYATGSVVWKGSNPTNPSFWDVNTTTQNFTLGGSDNAFFNGDNVTFDDTASSFNVAIQGPSVTAGAIVFNHSSNNYTVSGGAIAGATSTLTKSGTGTLTLTNNNTLAGNTTISGGTLQLGDGVNAAGTVAGAIINNGALILDHGANNLTLANQISGTGSLTQQGDGVITLTGANSYGSTTISSGSLQIGAGSTSGSLGSGAITNNGALIFNRSDAITVANAITGSGTLSKQGSSSLTLSNTNSYSGSTTVTAGALVVAADGALGTAEGSTTVSPNTSVGLSGGITYSTAETIRGSGVGTTAANVGPLVAVQRGFIQSVSGNNTFAGNIEISAAGTSRIGAQDGASLTLSGNITMASGVTGVTPLFRTGLDGDFVTLSGTANNWDGNTVIFSGGTTTGSGLRLGANNALPVNTSVVAGGNSTAAATSLDLAGYNQTLNGLVASNGALHINNSSGTLSTLTLSTITDQSNASVNNKTVIDDGAGSGKVALVKNGTANQTLVGTNTFTGGTTIEAGTLTLGHATDTLANSGAINVSGGTLAIGANSDTVGTVTLTSGGITGSTGVLTAAAYNVQSGTISAKLGGAADFSKSTSGIVTLSGTNTFTGTTNVSGGTLVVDGSISSTATLTVDAPATLRGTGSIASAATINGTLSTADSVSLGNLTFTSSLAVPGTLSLKFDSSTGVFDKVLANGFTATSGILSLTDIAGVPAILVPNSTYTLVDNTSLSSIGGAFTGVSEGASITVGGNTFILSYLGGTGNDLVLTAIPEPASFAALAGLTGLLATSLRRRRGNTRS